MNTVTATPDRVSLYYREGSSDKVYQAAIKPADGLFVVNFAYGRRGATLTTGTKTSTPVDYDTAKKIYTKLVGEKKAKGYTEGADGTPYQHTDKRVSGILPQLLNPIEEADVERLLSDDDYCAQEIVANMPQRPVIKHGMTAAYYSPTDDSIAMPDRNRFETEDHYHATLFHELVHATGHEKRLKRAGIMERNGYGSKPYGNMAKGWRKGRFLRPFCHLVIKAIRVDSHPFTHERALFSKALTGYRTKLDLTQGACAIRLGVSKKTLENWERGRTKPARKLWTKLKVAMADILY